MTFEVQPAQLAYAPPRYPGHRYEGVGTIYTIRVGYETDDVAGWLTLQGDAVGFFGTQPPWTAAGTIRVYVQDQLREGARLGVPLGECVAEILAHVWHDAPVEGPLDGFQGLASG